MKLHSYRAPLKFAYMKCILIIITNLLVFMNGMKSVEATNNDNSSTLSFVFSISRHGARVPTLFVKGDPNINYWKDGKGQLTSVGKNELYLLGKITRSRYRGFLDQLYKPEEIEVRSTKYERTMMSAQCFLAGLYPPKDAQVWNPTLAWQPIPVYLLDYALNVVMYHASEAVLALCPSGIQEDTFFNENKDIIEVLQNASNVRYTRCMDYTFFMLADMFVTEKFYNLTLPFGLDDNYEKIKIFRNAFIARWWAAPEMINGVNGLLFRDIIDALQMKRNNTITKKMYAYFMHDTNVLIFLAAITNYPLTGPSFAATITIELYQTRTNSTDDFNVKVYYTNAPTSTREIQYIKGCGHICPLQEFIELLHRVMIPPKTPKCFCK